MLHGDGLGSRVARLAGRRVLRPHLERRRVPGVSTATPKRGSARDLSWMLHVSGCVLEARRRRGDPQCVGAVTGRAVPVITAEIAEARWGVLRGKAFAGAAGGGGPPNSCSCVTRR